MSLSNGYLNNGINEVLSNDFRIAVQRGEIGGVSHIKLMGRNTTVGTSLVVVSETGTYEAEKTLQNLEILSTSGSDSFTGLGARVVRVTGTGAGYAEITEDVNMLGTTPVALANTFYRVYKAEVISCGAYGNRLTPSQFGTVTVRYAGGGPAFAVLPQISAGYGAGESFVGGFTVPINKVAALYLNTITGTLAVKTSLYLAQRERIDIVTAPYKPIKVKGIDLSYAGAFNANGKFLGVFEGKTDLFFMASTDSSAEVGVDCDIYLYDV